MNYFAHVSFFFDLVEKDKRLNTQHICIYIVLLHFWNKNRFEVPFYISKDVLLSFTKIGSTHTYYKRIRELHCWGYFIYEAGKNGVQRSQFFLFEFQEEIVSKIIFNANNSQLSLEHINTDVNMHRCENATLQVQKCYSTDANVLLYSSKNATIYNTDTSIHKDSYDIDFLKNKSEVKKENEFPPNEELVKQFFIENNMSETVSQKFYLYYSSLGWVTKNNRPIVDWQSLALLWIQNEYTVKNQVQNFINHSEIDYEEKF